MKIGLEVEGRYKGLRTLFLIAEEFNRIPSEDIIEIATENKAQQIYISDHNNEVLNQCTFHGSQWSTFKVTLEVTQVMFYQDHSAVHLLLVIPEENVWRLKPTDQIKFSRDHTVYAVPVESMYKTTPEDFFGDVEVEYDP